MGTNWVQKISCVQNNTYHMQLHMIILERGKQITNYFIIMSFKDSLNSKRNFDIIRNALITTTSYNSHNFTHPSKKRGIDKELKFSSSSDVKMGET